MIPSNVSLLASSPLAPLVPLALTAGVFALLLVKTPFTALATSGRNTLIAVTPAVAAPRAPNIREARLRFSAWGWIVKR
jgi:hypothetical protein